jgi:hypothetical protein
MVAGYVIRMGETRNKCRILCGKLLESGHLKDRAGDGPRTIQVQDCVLQRAF